MPKYSGIDSKMFLRKPKVNRKFDVFLREHGRWKFHRSIEAEDENVAKMKILLEDTEISPKFVSVYPSR